VVELVNDMAMARKSVTSVSPSAAPAAMRAASSWRERAMPTIGWALLLACWAALPWLVGRSIVDMFVFVALYAIAGVGVSFLLGQCGIVSLAQSAFYGIGAYSAAYGATKFGWPMAAL
jgi:ABC-type branched-subunit amino acid transport system permease subunit